MFYRFVFLALLTVGAPAALADGRLRIELLPVYILPDDTDDAEAALESAISSNYQAFVATRQAMAMLGVHSHEYDLALSEHLYDVLNCTQVEADDSETQCTHDDVGLLTWDQMNALYRTLGYTTAAQWWQPKGTILLLVLMKPDRLLWKGGNNGSASVAWWGGYNLQTSHWTTASCVTFVHLIVTTVAHELGHCFGLAHNGAGDRHFDGVDNSIDLMQATKSISSEADWLKASNQQRVRRHFRDLSDDGSLSLSLLNSLTPTQTNIIID
ncbi:reprolysin-like metallopeptidase [Candidatus Rariloculus sp.]|uniref:reprolysin-like metallopeptidase n=1 Tax=Candidatus Rariloculus sp. TaxID=3101265 RepID=UPI003D0A70F3